MSGEESVIQRLAEFVSGAELEPGPIGRRLIQRAVLDTFACVMAGSTCPRSRRIHRALASPAGPAPVFGTGLRIQPAAAALCNAVSGCCLEMDDCEAAGNTHVSVVLLPAILAAGADRPVSGRLLVEAYLAGYEVIARIGQIVNMSHYTRGWHATATLGALGAAAAVARAWRLDSEQTGAALSLACSRAVGYQCQFGTDAKLLQHGFAAELGLVVCQLARHGATGSAWALEEGLFRLMAGPGPGLGRLGQPLALLEFGLVLKPYPTVTHVECGTHSRCGGQCGYAHRILDCALELHPRVGQPVDSVLLRLPKVHANSLTCSTGMPATAAEAQFNLPYCAALALLRGKVTLADFHPLRRDGGIDDLVSKTEVDSYTPQHPELNYSADDPASVTVTLRDGSTLHSAVAFQLGSMERPMSDQQLQGKAVEMIGGDSKPVAELLAAVDGWAGQSDVSRFLEELAARLTPHCKSRL